MPWCFSAWYYLYTQNCKIPTLTVFSKFRIKRRTLLVGNVSSLFVAVQASGDRWLTAIMKWNNGALKKNSSSSCCLVTPCLTGTSIAVRSQDAQVRSDISACPAPSAVYGVQRSFPRTRLWNGRPAGVGLFSIPWSRRAHGDPDYGCR